MIAWWLLPSRAEVAALEVRRAQLLAALGAPGSFGASLDLRRCGAARRLCVRVDRKAPAYGEDADFLLVKAP